VFGLCLAVFTSRGGLEAPALNQLEHSDHVSFLLHRQTVFCYVPSVKPRYMPFSSREKDCGYPGFLSRKPFQLHGLRQMSRGLEARIRRCVEIVGNGHSMSQKTGIPRSTLETYLTGKAEPKISRLVAIAQAAGVSINWLATGTGEESCVPRSSDKVTMDGDLSALIVDGIAAVYRQEGMKIEPAHLGRKAAQIYSSLVNAYCTPKDREIGLLALLEQLRGELTS
jgi:transcriptional regulator with XRE-family HTH domain